MSNMNMSKVKTGKGNRKNNLLRDGDIIVKRMTVPAGQISSTAGGIITVSSFTAASVQSGPASEWASFAARYQQYRVRSVTMVMEPRFPGSGTPVTTSGSHGALYVSDFIGSATPSSAAQVLSDERSVVANTSKRIVFTVDWVRNPNAKLWNPTSAALPTANSFGIAVAGDSQSTLAASTAYFDVNVIWEVELRGSQ
jgi:hypothetical protein